MVFDTVHDIRYTLLIRPHSDDTVIYDTDDDGVDFDVAYVCEDKTHDNHDIFDVTFYNENFDPTTVSDNDWIEVVISIDSESVSLSDVDSLYRTPETDSFVDTMAGHVMSNCTLGITISSRFGKQTYDKIQEYKQNND